jgi:predicted outer membrane repeat protein
MDNTANIKGGGIYTYYSSVVISHNTIIRNQAAIGGGICLFHQMQGITGLLRDNRISDNEADDGGGGIFCHQSSPDMINNEISGNRAPYGGGLYCRYQSSPDLAHMTFSGNHAGNTGGAVFCENASAPRIINAILWGDTPDEVAMANGMPFIAYSDVEGGYAGPGNIDADPLFIGGAGGAYFLSQRAAGQAQDSPCVDAGEPGAAAIEGTTRTDALQDAGVTDMGYHGPFSRAYLLAGPGPAESNPALVRVFAPGQGGGHQYEFHAYSSGRFGVETACGDVDGDGYDEIITGAGPGGSLGPHIRGFEVSGRPLTGLNFLAYGTAQYGVHVSAGDLDGDGVDEIIAGAGPAALFAPHVRAFSYDGSQNVTPVPGVNFSAYGTRRRGVHVAGGDPDGDGISEIITGPGPGNLFGPHVLGWQVDGGPAEAEPGINFFAYQTDHYGVVVSCGDPDGNGIDDIVTAPGPSEHFGPHIRGWCYDGSVIGPLPGCNFTAWKPSRTRYGARVSPGADLDGDGRADIAVGAGPDPDAASRIVVFRYCGDEIRAWVSIQAFPFTWAHGVNVSAGKF